MFNRQSVRVTYAHKKKRVQNATKKLFSSPLEVLPPEIDDLTRMQMARRMLKRSRRVALAEQLEDKNVEHIREHLAKRIKHNHEHISNVGPIGVPFDIPPQHDITFQTPFPSSHSVHESAVTKPLVPEQLSPVPTTKHIVSRTSSRNLKENSTHSQTLASPFSSRPGSAASSPKHKDRGRSSRRALHNSLHVKSRTLSGVFKENARQVSQKNSTLSLKDTSREHRIKYIDHHRYLSSPSALYMRSQFAQEDRVVHHRASSRTLDDCDVITSPEGSIHSDASFYAGQPQSCSTPALSLLRKAPSLRGREITADGFFPFFSLRKDSQEAGGLNIEMTDGTVPSRRQMIHISKNSIFSSSGEFTIETLPETNMGATTVDGSDTTERVQVSARRGTAARLPAGHTLAGSFVAEYDIPLSDMACFPVSTAGTKMLGSEGVPKLSVGERSFVLPGTSPAYGGSLTIHACRRSGTPTPPTLPIETTVPCSPLSPASDLAQEFGSMDVCGDLDTPSDGETRRASAPNAHPTRAYSRRDALPVAEFTTKKSVKRMPTRKSRNRAGTIRASDFVTSGPGVSSSSGAPSLTGYSHSNVRRTRSGTVVGPHSNVPSKGAGTKSAPATRFAAVQSESESDDELLLKSPWTEDVEYLGFVVPLDKDADADELNLGGPLPRPARRLGLRKR